jgi:hypothetical protein
VSEGEKFNPALQSRRTALSWDKQYKDRVDDLRKNLSQDLNQSLTNRELFLICLAYGWYAKDMSPKVPPRQSDSARLDTLKSGDWALFNAIAMRHAKSFDVLHSKDEVLDIVESYASGGLKLLSAQLDAKPDLFLQISSDVWPLVESWSVQT